MPRLSPAPDGALDRPLVLRPGDDDYPTTPALRALLRDRGVIDDAAIASFRPRRQDVPPRPRKTGPCFTLGRMDRCDLDVDVAKQIADKCLIQGSVGAGKSMPLRHIVEQPHRPTPIILLGYFRDWTAEEDLIVRIAHRCGISITDLASALDRDVTIVSKRAVSLGLPFASQLRHAPRTPHARRMTITRASIIAMARPTGKRGSPWASFRIAHVSGRD